MIKLSVIIWDSKQDGFNKVRKPSKVELKKLFQAEKI